jgi:Transcription factor WhiB
MRPARWPVPLRVPLQPRGLADTGLCARHPHPEWWTSSRPLERETAAAVCGWCPALEACRTWSLSLPSTDNAVYGGLDARKRKSLRDGDSVPPAAGRLG